MSELKKHNSIIFLTTLSVYLGLVLVSGASSPILAQAALTRNFDIQEEIEYKDDLDKKPDEDLFALQISSLVNDLNNFSATGLFDWNKKSAYQIDLSFCESDNSPSFLGSGSVNLVVDEALEKTAIKVSRNLFGKIFKLGLGDIYSQTAEYKFVLDNNSLTLTTVVDVNHHVNDKKDIQPFVNSLTEYLAKISSTSKPTRLKIVAENTKITFENNQVFLITNLPRASIDSFLASTDAN